MSIENEIREASKQNGIAMNQMVKGDASQVLALWSHSANVTALHPTGSREIGWDAVQASFENFSKLASDGTFELRDQHITVAGELAIETGTEHVKGKLGGHDYDIQPRVTNVYSKQDGDWKMMYHHSEVAPGLLEVMGRL